MVSKVTNKVAKKNNAALSAWQLFWLLSKELGVCYQSSGHPDFNRIYDFFL
jgi:hypothetical protein